MDGLSEEAASKKVITNAFLPIGQTAYMTYL